MENTMNVTIGGYVYVAYAYDDMILLIAPDVPGLDLVDIVLPL